MKLRKGRAVAAIAVLAVILVSGVGCATKLVGGEGENSNSGGSDVPQVTTELPTEEPTTEPVPEDKRVHVVAAGDNLIHYSVYKNAEKLAGPGERFDFKPLYKNVKYIIEDADLAILNQETIISQSNDIRGANGGALLFNSPPEVADAVIDLGFDVFTMANNHLLDFGADALEESINFWNQKAEENDLTVLGAYLNNDDANDIRIREVNGVRIAFLAYAEHINGFEFPAGSPLRVVMNSEEDVIERQIKEAKEKADVVIVAAHWGVEDTHLVSEDRIELANKMVNWGADVILGCHTHTAETMEWITRDDGTRGFVFYSMGNFICAQTDNFNLVGEMPDFDIVMNGETGEITLENVGAIPNIIHYESPDFANLAVYPYSKYTPELAAAHGVPYAIPQGTYTSFGWDILNDIINESIPVEFQKLDK
ncbi:MAG: CapA family protein [Ruminococcus sp.]|uniref:CapA family protein n=1 Tax=Ruminococcus sp. TaxID=41978 RepID=UPI001B0F5212|nr:CapA family protein [Ruminococcus sp.]MBO7474097.1 CapA family protein [Ruminococcus sp.]